LKIFLATDLEYGIMVLNERAMAAVLMMGGLVGASVNGDIAPDGKPAQVVLPQEQRMHNTGGIGPGGPGTGAGLCVFTSIEMAARWQNVKQLIGLQKWMTRQPGGGYPEKVDKMIAQYCKEQGLTVPEYIQITDGDEEFLKRALKSRRMVCITYSYSPSGRYGGKRIAHMVNAINGPPPTSKEGFWGIMDNNYEKQIEWLSDSEFQGPFLSGGGGWAVVFLQPGPPPRPHN
jgi:hypothetical protein